jgi:hypothetical protein
MILLPHNALVEITVVQCSSLNLNGYLGDTREPKPARTPQLCFAKTEGTDRLNGQKREDYNEGTFKNLA